MLKNKPFTSSETSIINERARENNAELFVLPGVYAQPPYDELLTVNSQFEPNKQQQGLGRNIETEKINSIIELEPPTDDSPFFFCTRKSSRANGSPFSNGLVSVRSAGITFDILFEDKQYPSIFFVYLLAIHTICNIYRSGIYGY